MCESCHPHQDTPAHGYSHPPGGNYVTPSPHGGHGCGCDAFITQQNMPLAPATDTVPIPPSRALPHDMHYADSMTAPSEETAEYNKNVYADKAYIAEESNPNHCAMDAFLLKEYGNTYYGDY